MKVKKYDRPGGIREIEEVKLYIDKDDDIYIQKGNGKLLLLTIQTSSPDGYAYSRFNLTPKEIKGSLDPVIDRSRNRRCPNCNTILKGKYCYECGTRVKYEYPE